MEEITVTNLGSQPEYQEYSGKDLNLIEQKTIAQKFTLFSDDYIEFFIQDAAGEFIVQNYDDRTYTPIAVDSVTNSTNTLEIDPEADIARYQIDRGAVDITYNFYTKLFKSDFYANFWIAEVSDDRTEIRVVRNDLSNQELRDEFTKYQQKVNSLPYYPDFLLNFGLNRTLIGVNMLFAQPADEASLLIKLYEPLPDDLNIKDTFWLVNKLAEPITYHIDIELPEEALTSTYELRGPNFDIEIKKTVGQTTDLYNYNTLFGLGTNLNSSTTSSFNQIKSLLDEKSIDINVDYSDFSNFVHFSSAVERLYNFQYKLQQIELNQAYIKASGSISGSVAGSSLVNYNNAISNIIKKFDEYEYFLYYNNGPRAWPSRFDVTSSTHIPYSVTSSEAVNWLGSVDSDSFSGANMLFSASIYDNGNPDYLTNALPAYIQEDAENNPAFLFTSMLGQHFDNLYVYYKDVTNRFNATNDINTGISKDLVGDALKALGIKLYTNSNISDNLYYSILGISPDGNSSAEFSFPTGSEGGVSGSLTRISFPYLASGSSAEDIQAETYKRIYHNLPYLLKTKGTERGLRALISCFGIPDTILRVSEFGGISDETSLGSNAIHQHQEGLYSKLASGDNTNPALIVPWGPVGYDYLVNGEVKVPETFQLRFKSVNGHPTASYDGVTYGSGFYSSSTAIFHVGTGSSTRWGIQLEYISTTASQYSPLASLGVTGSAVSGSPYEDYAYMRLWLSGSAGYKTSSYLYLPFYDKTLSWNIYAYRETSSLTSVNNIDNRYWIYAEAPLYNAQGIAVRGFRGSASIDISGTTEASYNAAWNYNDSSSFGSASIYSSSIVYSGSFTGSENFYSHSLGGIYAGYLGGNKVGSTPFASASYEGVFQELRYWRTNLVDEAKAQHAFYVSSIAGNNETASLYDLTYRVKLSKDVGPDSTYFIGQAVVPGYLSDYLASISANVASIHPAVEGNFNLPGNLHVTSVPSFYLFSGSLGPTPVNGAAYTSSAYSANYTSFDSYELVTTPKSGPNGKVNTKVFSPTQTQITGSVLSPFVSIEKIDPSKTKNSLDIEVALSPADQIDDDIAQQFGTFDLDSYIGSPSDAYSSSYADLDTLKKTYFSKFISAYNVYDLVRAVKFYDNSLFKMIKDFVPMKANLSTGVVIKSHILERNKIARHEPVLSFVNYSASIDTAHISGSNGTGKLYKTTYTETIQGLTGSVTQKVTDNAAMYTGRFGGSTITVENTFNQKLDSSISNTTVAQDYIPSASLNYLFNNVTASRKSSIFLDLDYSYRADVPVNLDLIEDYYLTRSLGLDGTSPYWPFAQIQDSDYSRFTYISPRYIGSKTSSSLYNTYSISDDNINHMDRAYGKTAAIGSYTKKLGLFTQVVSSSFFSQRNNFALIYLVDESGSFTELNTDNKNWEDLQNTFKQGNKATVKLFDNQKYSDQRTTEGVKPIFNSGYSYKPMVYFNQGVDTKLYFSTATGNGTSTPRLFTAVNSLSPNSYLNGVSSPKYALATSGSAKAAYGIFDAITLNQGNHYIVGGGSSWPSYNVSENGSYKFTASLDLAVTHSTSGSSITYTLDVISTNPTTVLGTSTKTTSNVGASLTLGALNSRFYVSSSRVGNELQVYTHSLAQDTTVYSADGTTAVDFYPSGTYLYIATGSLGFYISNSIYANVGRDSQVVYATSPTFVPSYTSSFFTNVITSTTGSIIRTINNPDNSTYYYIDNPLTFKYGGTITGNGPFTSSLNLGSSTATLNFAISTGNQALLSGSKVEFRLYENSSTFTNYTASLINSGAIGVTTTTQISGLYPYATSSTTDASVGTFISRSIYPNTFVLNKEISNLYGYTFLPGFSSGSNQTSSLYSNYGDVDYNFNLNLGDVLIVQQGSFVQEFDIVNTSTSADGALSLTVSPEINDVFISNLPETASFLSKRRDESNMILTFPKKAGTTSYGIVIPDNISPEVLKNIDTITKEIQQKLIDMNGLKQSDTSVTSATSNTTPTPTPGGTTPTPTPTPGGPTPTPTPTPTPGGPTPTPTTYSKLLNNSSTQPNSTSAEACTAYNTYNRRMYYSAASFFTNGMTLYLNSSLTSIAPDGYYSDGTNSYFFSGGTYGGGSTSC